MTLEEIYLFCSAKNGVSEHFPFDTKTLVFKVYGKMFALIDVDTPDSINLKCNPERAPALREQYSAVRPGFHMNHKHWNTVLLNQDVDNHLIKELIDHSYELVYSGLPKKVKDANPR